MTVATTEYREIVSRSVVMLGKFDDLRWVTPYLCEVRIGAVAIAVSYDASRSQELIVSVRENGQNEPAFEIADLLRVTTCPSVEYGDYELMQTGAVDVLERLLRGVFGLLVRYGGEFLSGDSVAFSRARRDRSQRAARITQGVNDGPILSAAERAWHARDFDHFVRLLGPLRTRLGDRDRRRLEYARRSIGANAD